MLTSKRMEYIINDTSMDTENKISQLMNYVDQSNKEDLIMYLLKEIYVLSKDKDILSNYIKTQSDKIMALEDENRELCSHILNLKDKIRKKGKRRHGFKDYDYEA